ncbi:DUF1972 domain-containing protein [Winogradskyella helgolandensis]|uniref:DUF1972 domain-containing protein n=1 Tax=Winogradskyella helgolandensis TaxID=2697010 RepID=UPI0015C721C0|nr:DUF1972 domain-containing protein [Winogradskyella helgolandensis]
MNKKVAIIGTVGIPAKYGGFETLIEYITKELHSKFDFTVYCSAKAYPEQKETHNNCKLEYINLEANGMQSVIYDTKSIFHALKYADVLLILGVSGCLILPFIKLISKNKIIVNIDGLEWKRQKWNKYAKAFLKFSEKCAVNYADITIADNKVIKDHVYDTYGKEARLIAYGGNHTESESISDQTLLEYPFLKSNYAFKVCRIEPENNIEIILKAFSTCPELTLVIVGNWDNSTFGKTLRDTYRKFQNLHLLDPIYNQKILNELRSNCYLYVHGHSAGGTNPSLVEAMSLGLPIVAYGIHYNRETTQNKALYFKTSEELAALLKQIDTVDLDKLAQEMQHVANQEYTWEKIADAYQKLMQ